MSDFHRPVKIDKQKNEITCYCGFVTREHSFLDQAWDEYDEIDRHTEEED